MPKKLCSKCKTEFNCGAEASGCWCENYSIPNETLKQLKNDFDNCLCENCLKEYSGNGRK